MAEPDKVIGSRDPPVAFPEEDIPQRRQLFPLEVGDKERPSRYTLFMESVAKIIRDGQNGSLPMTGEIHMAVSLLHVHLALGGKKVRIAVKLAKGGKAHFISKYRYSGANCPKPVVIPTRNIVKS